MLLSVGPPEQVAYADNNHQQKKTVDHSLLTLLEEQRKPLETSTATAPVPLMNLNPRTQFTSRSGKQRQIVSLKLSYPLVTQPTVSDFTEEFR